MQTVAIKLWYPAQRNQGVDMWPRNTLGKPTYHLRMLGLSLSSTNADLRRQQGGSGDGVPVTHEGAWTVLTQTQATAEGLR